MEIAGKLTIKDWAELEKKLIIDNDENWGLAFHFFEERIRTRYLNPINAILEMDLKTGEGFAVVNLQCSLIETIESFINGWIYHNDGEKKSKKGWFKNKVSDETYIIEINNNLYIFESFFKNHLNFKGINGNDFYFNVRCSLLHETQTKNNWKIKKGLKFGKIFKEKDNFKIIYRDNFQRDLEKTINLYKTAIIKGQKFNNIESKELRENFKAKFNHICEKSN